MTALEYGDLLLNIMSVSYSLRQGIYTDSDMQDEELRRKMEKRIDELLNFATHHGLNMTGSGEVELVVQLENLTVKCEYYFVDHLNRSLFWIQEQDGKDLCDGVRGVREMGHISAPSDAGNNHCLNYHVYRICCRISILASLPFCMLVSLYAKLF